MFRINCVAPSRPDYSVELTATAHLQPLAQPTPLPHPGSRCDIDSHPDCRPFLTLIVAPQTATGWDGHTFSFVTRWNEWSDGAPETFRYHAAVRLDGRRVTSVEHAEVVRTVPWFASAEPHDLGGESSVIHMVPRSFHDAPFKPLNPYGAVVVRYLPGAVQLVTG